MSAQIFDVIVVGGGVFGTAIAFYLAERRAGSILLLEGRTIAAGATGWSSGIVRVHYTNRHEARLAATGTPVFREWRDRVGGECGFHRTGFLRIAGAADRANLLRNVEMLRTLGTDVSFLEPDEVRRLQPYVSVDGIAGAAYEPDGGYGSGTDTARGFAAAAAERGVTVRQGIAVRGLRIDGHRSAGVETADALIASERVVVAAGAWSFPLLREAGMDLPLRTKLVRAGLLVHPAGMAAEGPYMTVIDDSTGTYFRPDRANRTELGLRYEWDVAPSYDPVPASLDLVAEAAGHLVRRVPAFEQAGLVRGWGAVDGYSPDGAPVLGAAPGIDGLYLAVAAGGTGFKISPAVGMGMADLLTRGASEDLHPFRPTRFAEGAPVTGDADYARPNWRNQPLAGATPPA
jgi:glycine/D-amino acid oxidase-like deaminating enzyme